MAKPKTYSQCSLEQEITGGVRKKVCWIPTEKATVDNLVKLKDIDGWWLVKSSGPPMDAKIVEANAHNSSKIWEATSGDAPRGNK